jgi:ribosomal protein L7/L12
MTVETDIIAMKARISELEDRLEYQYRRLNMDYADPNADPVLSPAIQEALRRGNKIEAIKIYRELTGIRLKPKMQ